MSTAQHSAPPHSADAKRSVSERAGLSRLLIPPVLWTFSVFLLMQLVAPLASFEQRIQDFRLRLRPSPTADPRVAVVSIDEQTLQESSPAATLRSRARHAAVVRRLTEAGAVAIGFDILFSSPSSNAGEDRIFAQAIMESGCTVLPLYQRTQRSGVDGSLTAEEDHSAWLDARQVKLSGESAQPAVNAYTWGLPAPELRDAIAATGYTDVPAEDGVYRSLLPFRRDSQGRWLPALSTALYLEYAKRTGGRGVELLPAAIRATPDEAQRINFVRDLRAIPHHSYAEVLDSQRFRPEWVRGKIVLIGETHGTADIRPNPSSSIANGIEIHANSVNSLLQGRFLASTSKGADLLILLCFSLLASLVLTRMNIGAGILVLAAAPVLYLGGSQLLFIANGLMLPVLSPLAAGGLTAWTCLHARLEAEERQRRKVEAHWRSYVGPEVMQAILTDPDLAQGRPVEANVTVMFSDIRGYSGLSEKQTPEQVIRQINEHFDQMANDVFEVGGTVMGVTGDGLLMVFGWPQPFEDHADRACIAARRIVQGLVPLNNRWRNEGRPCIDIGLGLHSGVVVAGRVGSEEGSQMTVIGDVVNVSARVQDLNKPLKTRILITEDVKSRLRRDYPFGKSESVPIRGRVAGITVFELLETENGETDN